MQVSLRDIVFSCGEPVEASRQKDPLSLATCFWLNYESFGFSSIKLLLERFEVLREQPSAGEEIVIVWEILLHGT